MNIPSVGLVDPEVRLLRIVEATLPLGIRSHLLNSNEIVNVVDYWVLLVDAASLRSAEIHAQLQKRLSAQQCTDLVLVYRNSQAAHVSGFAGYVSDMDSQESLWSVTRRAGARAALQSAKSAVAAQAGLVDPLVLKAQSEALDAAVPFDSVSRLIAHLGCGERTLRRRWHESVVLRGGFPLGSLVESVLLLQLLALDPRMPQQGTRKLWGIAPDRPGDIARRLVGRTFPAVRAGDFPTVVAWFRQNITSFLTGTSTGESKNDRK